MTVKYTGQDVMCARVIPDSGPLGYYPLGTGEIVGDVVSYAYPVGDPRRNGIYTNGVIEASGVIQKAITALVAQGGGVLPLPPGKLLISTPLNLANLGSTMIEVVGAAHSEGFYNVTPLTGTSLYGRTGSQAVIETQGSHYVTLRDFSIYSMLADANRSAVGIFIGRTTFQASAQYHNYQRVFITLANNAAANAARGSIALYNVTGEHGVFDHLQLISDTPLVSNDNNALTYVPTYGTIQPVTSCSLNEYRECAFISLSAATMEIRGLQSTSFIDCYYGSYQNLGAVAVQLVAGSEMPAGLRFIGGQCEHFSSFMEIGCDFRDIDIDVIWAEPTSVGTLVRIDVNNNQIGQGLNARFTNTHDNVMDIIGVGAATGVKLYGGKLILEDTMRLDIPTLGLYGTVIEDNNVSPVTVHVIAGSQFTLRRASGCVIQGNRATAAWTTSWTPNASLSPSYEFAASVATTAFTINAPTYPMTGQSLELTAKNTSGGALGTATFDPVFKLAAWTNPANGFSRTIAFRYNGTNWIETGRTPADVPN